jgi:hypothetical protein
MDILDTLNLYPQLQARLHEYARQRKEAMDMVRGLTGRTATEQQPDIQDSHQDILTAAATIKDMPRAKLEGVLMAAVLAGTVSMADIRRSQDATWLPVLTSIQLDMLAAAPQRSWYLVDQH